MFEDTREYLKKIGLPSGDLFDMPTSTQRFPDGGAYRIEVPTVNTAESVAAVLDTATKNGITINRVTETYGMFRNTRAEIKEYCRLCHDYGAELLMSVGPRAPYDTGATVLSSQGVRISYRLRGMEQVLRGVAANGQSLLAVPFHTLANRGKTTQEVWVEQQGVKPSDDWWLGQIYRPLR